jgi:hypothetical protein
VNVRGQPSANHPFRGPARNRKQTFLFGGSVIAGQTSTPETLRPGLENWSCLIAY